MKSVSQYFDAGGALEGVFGDGLEEVVLEMEVMQGGRLGQAGGGQLRDQVVRKVPVGVRGVEGERKKEITVWHKCD